MTIARLVPGQMRPVSVSVSVRVLKSAEVALRCRLGEPDTLLRTREYVWHSQRLALSGTRNVRPYPALVTSIRHS